MDDKNDSTELEEITVSAMACVLSLSTRDTLIDRRYTVRPRNTDCYDPLSIRLLY